VALRFPISLLLLVVCTLPAVPRVIDDVYISYAYALSLLEHGSLTWDGTRVEGYSNFSWVLLLASVRAFGLPITWATKVASLVAAVALLYGVHRRAPRSVWGTALVAAVAVWPALNAWAGLGMETTTFAALLFYGWAATIERRWTSALGILAIGALTRPEGILYVLAALALALVSTKGRLSRTAWATVAGLCAYEIARLWYFHGAVPTTVIAKLASPDDPLSGARQTVGELLGASPIALLALAAFRTDRRTLLLAAGPVALHAAMLLVMNGDWMGSTRIQLPGIAAALGAMLTGAPRMKVDRGGHLRWLTLATLPILAFEPARAQGFVPRVPALAAAAKKPNFTLRPPLIEDAEFVIHTVPDGASFETGDVGVPGLIPGVHLLDAIGLVDPVRARWLAGLSDSAAVDARYSGADALACVRRYANDKETQTPRFRSLISRYRLVRDVRTEGQRHRWWCQPNLPAPDEATILKRWQTLSDRLPEFAEIRWHAARQLAQSGAWEQARALYAAAPFREDDAETALLFTSGPVPTLLGSKGFGLAGGESLRTRPLDEPFGEVTLQGPPGTVRVEWLTEAGAAAPPIDVACPGRVPLSPPVRGAWLRLTRSLSAAPPTMWVRLSANTPYSSPSSSK
jgi:hypothetical protein